MKDSHNVCNDTNGGLVVVEKPALEKGLLFENVEGMSKKELDNLGKKLDVPADVLKGNRPGGLYAVCQLARQVTHYEGELRRSYLTLCKTIRAEQMTPAAVAWCLEKEGFRKGRIAEIKRVCFASKEIFAEFEGRCIGFKAALERAREEEGEGANKPTVGKRWNKLLASFDRFTSKYSAPRPYHVANGRALLMWRTDAMKDDRQEFTFHGFRVVVERVNKTSTEEKKQNDKKSRGRAVPTGAAVDGGRISERGRGEAGLPG